MNKPIVPPTYFQGLELKKNPYYKNINSSSTRLEPLNKPNNSNSLFNIVYNIYTNIKNKLF